VIQLDKYNRLLAVVALLLVLALGTFGVRAIIGGRASAICTFEPATSTLKISPASVSASPSGSVAQVVPAHVRSFALPTGNAGLMMPALDTHGNVWVGEMQLNRLARLDSGTGQVDQWAPPNGQYTIMQAVTDGNGCVWFTEQGANYIGRFDPGGQTFTTYPLPHYGSHRFGPQDLLFDAHGILWFTGLESGRIGRLDPHTGRVQTWPVPSLPGQPSLPYGLALAPDGRVWYGELDGSVGWLDPTTGATQLYPLADSKALVFSMAADGRGHIWFTELSDGKLGRIDTATKQVTELSVPSPLGSSQGMYQDVIGSDGTVWFACSGANALVRYSPSSGQYTFYQLPQSGSVPYGLALDSSGHLWFTGDGMPNYIGELQS
jgi:virginiamycin B lyase